MKQKIYFEILWIIATMVLVALILTPIYFTVGHLYPFYFENILIIIIAITFGRYIFFLKHHWITYSIWFKVILIFFPIGVFMFLIDSFYEFQRFFDEQGIRSIMDELPNHQKNQMATFIRTEMVLFWAAAMLTNALLPIRMLISIWKKLNKGVH